ncbi:MAG: Nif11-like leader peptide family natural product precursor [Cyanobacteria bacterium P01_E01_bin.42]
MSEVRRLFQAAQANPELREEMNKAPDEDTFVHWANLLGYQFTLDEWKQATSFTVEEEINENFRDIPGI